MLRRLVSCCLLGLLVGLPSAAEAELHPEQRRPRVLVAYLEDRAINPLTARFVERAIRSAEQTRAECLVLVLDTPGGLVDSTRKIVRRMLASNVPVVVYVAPSGARAASAGVFITLAGHIAAMASGTHIGAAHPVQIGGLPGPADRNNDQGKARQKSPMEIKTLNDTVAWARALAELRGRNAEWAAQTVRESISVPASEALQEGAIDVLAQDLQDLLNRLDGREVMLPGGQAVLQTKDVLLQTERMWWGEKLLAAITNPNLAFLLLMIGFYGVLFELYSPGWGVAGTLGIICLLLGFLALSILPVNYVGLALLVLAMGLFVAEAFVTSYGLLALAGVGCLVLGGLTLVDSPTGFQRISLGVVIPVAAATGLITVFLVGSIIRAHRGVVRTGHEAITGSEAVAEEDFALDGIEYAGFVRTHGELWKAVSRTPVVRGQSLAIERREGLTLRVRVIEQPSVASPNLPRQKTNE